MDAEKFDFTNLEEQGYIRNLEAHAIKILLSKPIDIYDPKSVWWLPYYIPLIAVKKLSDCEPTDTLEDIEDVYFAERDQIRDEVYNHMLDKLIEWYGTIVECKNAGEHISQRDLEIIDDIYLDVTKSDLLDESKLDTIMHLRGFLQ
jgi:hypothetical protein